MKPKHARKFDWSNTRMLMPFRNRRRSAGVILVISALVVSIVVVLPRPDAGAVVQAPSAPPSGTQLCNGGPDASLLTGPSTAPAGAVTIPAGNDDPTYDQSYSFNPNTTYYFATGPHTLGTSHFGQFTPKNGDTFIGAPGAVINGEGINQSAFVGTATGVTIEYLTVENFIPGTDASAVNHDGASNWTIQYNTIKDNTGAGTGIGSNDVVNENCLTDNDQYGFSAVSSMGPCPTSSSPTTRSATNDTNGTYDQSSYVVSYAVSATSPRS